MTRGRRKLTVYLAGPITGCDYAGATDWREKVAEELGDDFICLSPMRAKEYLANETDIAKSYDAEYAEGEGLCSALSSAKGINARDAWDCRTADVVFVNLLGAKRVSIGTVMEVAWAFIARKPSIVVQEKGNIHEHPMMYESSSFVVENLETGIQVLKALR